ncbi:flavodoxin family protein [Clostridium sp.]|jgi:flavodoxin|uniref:flavodoxin family protein n=1 Tax=Clostridium sp. TaxID=1506 RepID=UPI003A5C474B
MRKLNAIVVYYSRTGTTKKVAQAISKSLECDIEEIDDKKNRKGPFGALIAGKDSLAEKETEIVIKSVDVSKYDILIIGSPVWASHITPAVRTYIDQNKSKIKKVAFFTTQAANDSKKFKIFEDMEKLTGIKPMATLVVSNKEIGENKYMKKIEQFKLSLFK